MGDFFLSLQGVLPLDGNEWMITRVAMHACKNKEKWNTRLTVAFFLLFTGVCFRVFRPALKCGFDATEQKYIWALCPPDLEFDLFLLISPDFS